MGYRNYSDGGGPTNFLNQAASSDASNALKPPKNIVLSTFQCIKSHYPISSNLTLSGGPYGGLFCLRLNIGGLFVLTDAKARAAKPKDKDYKIAAGEGLYLLVRTNGGKYWKLKFRFGGKERKLSLGVYPAVSLREAREKATEAKAQLRQGINPSEQKRLKKAAKLQAQASSLSAISAEWVATHIEDKSASHQKRTKATLARHLLPYLGDRPLVEITAVELLALLRRAESAGLIDSAHRARQLFGQTACYKVYKRSVEVWLSSTTGVLDDPQRHCRISKVENSLSGLLISRAKNCSDLCSDIAHFRKPSSRQPRLFTQP